MKVHKKPDKICSVFDMQDGDLAVIQGCNHDRHLEGQIVQRWGAHLILLGAPAKNSFTMMFGGAGYKDFSIEVLPKGTLLEV